MRWVRGLVAGAAAGAAGTTALNMLTYLDMSVRGRPTSSTPEDTVEKLADKVGVTIPGDRDDGQNRVQGLGPLIGILTGVGTGAALGVARSFGWRPGTPVTVLAASLGALIGADVPMTALGITDPRTWPAKDWAADVVPHLGYGIAVAWVLGTIPSDA